MGSHSRQKSLVRVSRVGHLRLSQTQDVTDITFGLLSSNWVGIMRKLQVSNLKVKPRLRGRRVSLEVNESSSRVKLALAGHRRQSEKPRWIIPIFVTLGIGLLAMLAVIPMPRTAASQTVHKSIKTAKNACSHESLVNLLLGNTSGEQAEIESNLVFGGESPAES